MLQGAKLAGGNPKNKRVENDFYATNPKAVEMLLEKYTFKGKRLLEPCVGEGHIIQGLDNYLHNNLNGISVNDILDITTLDICDRGCPNTIVTDFLTWDTNDKYDIIISNPPFSLAEEFCRKGLSLLDINGQMAMFLKIQFLEGVKRKEFFEKYPPKYIYVFRNRMATWNNGQPLDPNGKRWATTMCHAWFVWEKDNKEEPIVRWLDLD